MLATSVFSVGNMMVVGGTTEGASLVSSEGSDMNGRSGRPESSSAGMIKNLEAVDEVEIGRPRRPRSWWRGAWGS